MTEPIAVYRVANADPTTKPFRCPTCKGAIGETNGTSLTIGDALFTFVITFQHKWCGGMVQWRPIGSNGKGRECREDLG